MVLEVYECQCYYYYDDYSNVYSEHPIIIDDSTESKTKVKALPRKRQRTNHHDPLESACSTLSKFSEVNQLLRSSKKIVVVSGAGISAKAGCELIFCIIIHHTDFMKFLPLRTYESLNKP